MAMEVLDINLVGLNALPLAKLLRMGFSKYNERVKKPLLHGFSVRVTDADESRKRT